MSAAVHTPLIAPRPTLDTMNVSSGKESKKVDARLLKKREADRKCQRKIRERAKARVASLEQVVEELKQKDTSGQVEALLKKLTEKNAEIEVLNRKVKNIQAVLSDQDSTDDTSPINNAGFENANSGYVAHTTDDTQNVQPLPGATKVEPDNWELQHLPGIGLSLQDDVAAPLDAMPYPKPNTQLLDLHQDFGQISTTEVILDDADPIIPASQTPCDCSEPSSAIGAPRNIWRFANEVLTTRFTWPDYINSLEDPLMDDTPVRAVVEGWDAVEHRGALHPSWQLLKRIDQGIFWNCNPRERLAVLHVMHMLFNAHSRPEMISELPEFYRKRPSEEIIHSYAINFFTWPGMRERFVQQQHRYCTNDFWKILTSTLRILWPYEFRDCYTRNVETGLYTISPLFSDRLRDIKVWTVGPDMIQRWPEFNTDIPVFNSIPPAISNQAQNFKLLGSSMHQLSHSNRSRHKSEGRAMISDGTIVSQPQSPHNSSPKSTISKSTDILFGHDGQSTMWEANFSSNADIFSDSDYLGAQSLDSYTIPYT